MLSRIIRQIISEVIILFIIVGAVEAASFEEITTVSKEIAGGYYARGLDAALKYPELRNYSDHGIHHAETVAIKSQAAADAINATLANNPFNEYYAPIDKLELQAAAYLHDTGMDGGIFKEYTDGNALRKDHSLNSAIHVLENRSKIAALGLDVDSVAVDCMAHSKSCSGVRDLTSAEQWLDCFKRIEDAVALYNAKHEAGIYFDKSRWVDGNGIKREEIAKTAALSAALRVGDANREAAQYPYTQSGAHIEVDFESYEPEATSWQEEVANAEVILIGLDGVETSLKTDSVDPKGYDRMYSTGEGNLSMDCLYDDNRKAVLERFKVLHALSFPLSTQACIEERLEELDTMKKLPVEAEVELMLGGLSKREIRKAKRQYKRYCKAAQREHGYRVKMKVNRGV